MTKNSLRDKFTGTLGVLALTAGLGLSGIFVLGAWVPVAYAAPARSAGKPSASSAIDEKSPPIDVNTADADKLTTLPGIGKAIAQRIIDYRKEHGPFKKVEELLNVRGIGDRSLARIKDRVTVTTKD